MRRLFAVLAALSLVSVAGCLTMGKCDCDENVGCGTCGICSGLIQKLPPKHEAPKPLPKEVQKSSEPADTATTEAAPAPGEPGPAATEPAPATRDEPPAK